MFRRQLIPFLRHRGENSPALVTPHSLLSTNVPKRLCRFRLTAFTLDGGVVPRTLSYSPYNALEGGVFGNSPPWALVFFSASPATAYFRPSPVPEKRKKTKNQGGVGGVDEHKEASACLFGKHDRPHVYAHEAYEKGCFE